MTFQKGPKLAIHSSSFEHPRSRLSNFIGRQHFVHATQLLLPSLEISPEKSERDDLVSTLSLQAVDAGSYYAVRTKISDFIHTLFLEQYIRSQAYEFRALSVATPLDRTDAAAITPDGFLHMSITQDAYEQIGLNGSVSDFNKDVRRITIKLTTSNFREGRHHYDRVMDCLRNRTGPLDFICAASPVGEQSNDILTVPELLPGAICSQVPNDYSQWTQPEVFAPRLGELRRPSLPNEAGEKGTLDNEQLQEALEWLGMASCGVDGEAEEGCERIVLHAHMWNGLILPSHVESCVREGRRLVAEGACPWAALLAWGFVDSPVSWGDAEHSRGDALGGENDYVILLLPGDEYMLFVLSGAGDAFRKI